MSGQSSESAITVTCSGVAIVPLGLFGLGNNTNLMQELSKIYTTINKLDPNYPNESVLVVDSTIGSNALSQALAFSKRSSLSKSFGRSRDPLNFPLT